MNRIHEKSAHGAQDRHAVDVWECLSFHHHFCWSFYYCKNKTLGLPDIIAFAVSNRAVFMIFSSLGLTLQFYYKNIYVFKLVFLSG